MKLWQIGIAVMALIALLLVPAAASADNQPDQNLILVETVVVQASSYTPVSSVNVLANNADYVLKVSGTWQDTSQPKLYNDAEYTTNDSWTHYMDGTVNWGPDQKDLMVDNAYVDWGDYNSAHEYELAYEGTGAKVKFMVRDWDTSGTINPTWYADNAGSLTVKIYKCPLVAASLMTKSAKFDFKTKPDDFKVDVDGTIGLDLVNGDGADISEPVTVTIGTLSETIFMKAKGKNNETWEYQRPVGGTGNIQQMSINWQNGNFWKYGKWNNFWKNGKALKDSKVLTWNYGDFSVRMDRGNLNGTTNPVTIGIQIGNDLGQEAILMDWSYQASPQKNPPGR